MGSRTLLTEKEDCTHGIPKTPCELAPIIQIPSSLSLNQSVDPSWSLLSTTGDQSKFPGSENQHNIPDHEIISQSKIPPKRILTISFEELHAWHQILQNYKETVKSESNTLSTLPLG